MRARLTWYAEAPLNFTITALSDVNQVLRAGLIFYQVDLASRSGWVFGFYNDEVFRRVLLSRFLGSYILASVKVEIVENI